MANIEIRQETPTAFYIKVHDTDNVAIIVNDNGLKAGTRFPDGLELIEHIPQGHKVALLDIPANGEIIRYGEVIGYAVRAIPRGSWIDESMVVLPEAPPLHTLPLATKVPEPLPPLEGYTFEGYRNADGSVGTKNLLGITTSVHCVAGVVDYVVKIIERDLLPKYPNVDGVVGLNHLYGCGVAINAPAAVVPIRTIHNISLNPNFGGEVMVIGLGCEKLQPERLLTGTDDVQAIPVESASIVSLQDEKHVGFQSMVEDILQVAERHLQKLNQRQRETCPASELVVGIILAMERSKQDVNSIQSTKIAVGAPLGGIGDAMFWLTLLPICGGIGASLALQGSILGAVVFIVLFNVVHLGLRFGLAHYAYRMGVAAIPLIKANTKKVGHAASIVGMTVIGALVATYVRLSTTLEITAGDAVVKLQADVIDKLMPAFLPLVYTLTMFWLVRRG
ncbi:TPA: PTS system mannose/fructose/sorbose family transporter subunit IID [Shigella flexneri]|nr:PTS system mannose/fructose/sorbose family transporter subunit IID [Shigella flexneri]